MRLSANAIARSLALLAVLFWGAAYLLAKAVLIWLPPFAAAGARYAGAALILLVVLVAQRGNPFKTLSGHWVGYLLMGFIGIACFQAVFFAGLQFTSPVSAAVIMALTPAFTALGAAVFLGESLTLLMIAGMVLSVTGAALAVLGDNPRGIAGLSLDAGEPLVLLGALCMAFYTVASRRLMRKDVSALENTAVVLAVGAVFLLPLALYDAPAGPPTSSAPVIALVALVLGPTVIGYLAWNRATATIGIAEPNLIFNFIPVVTMVLSALHGERPWPEQVVGAALVIGGVTLGMMHRSAAQDHHVVSTHPIH
jgi:drug/metabolite transporter (DMT)-like permease